MSENELEQNFTDKEIAEMDGRNALKFWKNYKETILNIHKNLPEVH